MSFVQPKNYKLIADKLGAAYAAIRDAIYDANSATEGAYNKLQESLIIIVDEDDSVTYHDADTDPTGSISSDLGSYWYRAANNTLTEEQAKTIAANLFSTTLRKLNSHVVSRSGTGSIEVFYSTYAFVSGNTDFSLFTENDQSSYFTTEFAELSAKANVTINPLWIEA